MSQTVDLLFVAAHADDLELSCGGTIAKAVSDGTAVGMLELTHGEMGTRGTTQTRKREAKKAAQILGVAFREHLDFGDGGLRTGRDEEMQLIEFLRRARPKLVFAPWPDERHPDHVRTGKIVTDASFYAGLRQIHTKFAAHRPQAVIYYMQNYLLHPSFVIDVTDSWETKMKAIGAFQSQFFNSKSKEPRTFVSEQRFMEMIDARGKHFGGLIGARYGEGYLTKRPPRVDDVIAAYAGREV
ncbi:MAG TPA: bacillithiol biosynthesis deacetylase BshB1 [Thermoanaerobaculia bacterium]|jgi:bacillithiol biosynthesis deacetylase BshB1|nr:bacillithiol biosynthesis deacetylase BshB1 [Thermoanaerobaculia bacterium]